MKPAERHSSNAVSDARKSDAQIERHLGKLKATLSTGQRQQGRLFRRLGQRALEVLTEKGSVDLRDTQTLNIFEKLLKLQRENVLLTQKIHSLEAPDPETDQEPPPKPGTNPRFPFSR